MPKVLRILNRFNIGGPIHNAAYLSKYLAPKYETLLLGGAIEPSEKDAFHILDDLGIDYKIIPHMGRSIHPAHDKKALHFIEKTIKEFKPDIVHTHASKAGALGRIAAKKLGVPCIVHTFHGHVFHSYFSPWKTTLYKMIERSLARKSDAIIAISAIQKQELAEVYRIAPAEKIHVIPLGFDLDKFQQNQRVKRDRFRAKYHLDENTLAIGTIGRLVPIKNHSLFLSAIQHLKQNTKKKWKAFIIGDGESRLGIESKAKELGLTISHAQDTIHSEVVFTSFIQEMDEVMAGLDIVVLSSLNEGTPVSLIEAQAAGKPILTTRVGGVMDIVEDELTALSADVHNIADFHTKLLRLLTDTPLRQKMQSAGPTRVLKNYHYSRLTADMDMLYTQLLTQKI